jgi:OOP family OmpA-OmpF porin
MLGRKIGFDPGSAEIDSASAAILDAIAKGLKNCTGVKIEIAGHTDAQGSSNGNLALSQARAEAVMVALQGRQVDVSGMKAVGYGEGVPIADNGDDDGREANRRIEFTLMGAPVLATSPDGAARAEATASQDAAVPADGPSLAPQEKTERPKTRPKG